MHTEVRDCYKRLSSVHTSSPLSLSLSRLFILSPVLKCSCVDIFTHYTGKGRCLHVSVCVCVCVCVCDISAALQSCSELNVPLFFSFQKWKNLSATEELKKKKNLQPHYRRDGWAVGAQCKVNSMACKQTLSDPPLGDPFVCCCNSLGEWHECVLRESMLDPNQSHLA